MKIKINQLISRDNKKAILNGGDLEVEIKNIYSIDQAETQKLSKKYTSKCGFIKIESNNIYDCHVYVNNLQDIFDNMDIETASKILPKLWSSFGRYL